MNKIYEVFLSAGSVYVLADSYSTAETKIKNCENYKYCSIHKIEIHKQIVLD